ncbi:uncharacterized protein LOC116179520 [Photinus pyralis]|nr:uncharacterized protein LOC116179520 [Photinus pyralis]
MNILLLLTFVHPLVYQIFALRDVMDDLSQGMAKCYERLNEKESIVVSESDKDEYLKENSPIINQFYECSFKEGGFVDGNNKIDFYLLKNALLRDPSFSKKDVDRALLICKTSKGVDLGADIVKLLNCLARNKVLH